MQFRKNHNQLEVLDGSDWKIFASFRDPILKFSVVPDVGVLALTGKMENNSLPIISDNLCLFGFDGRPVWRIQKVSAGIDPYVDFYWEAGKLLAQTYGAYVYEVNLNTGAVYLTGFTK